MARASDTTPWDETTTPKRNPNPNPVVKDARCPRELIKPINLPHVKVPMDPCLFIKAAIYANKSLSKPKWGGNPPPRNPTPNNEPLPT